MASHKTFRVSAPERETIRNIFNKLSGGESAIPVKLLARLCKILGDPLSVEELEDKQVTLDNGDGLIEWSSFIEWWIAS